MNKEERIKQLVINAWIAGYAYHSQRVYGNKTVVFDYSTDLEHFKENIDGFIAANLREDDDEKN